MPNYLVIHCRYKDVQIGLFNNNTCIQSITEDTKKISTTIFILLDKLLNQHKLTLGDITFIAVHRGPAPFTTLRTTLAIANGIAYAKKIPLIGINGLDALLYQYAADTQITVVLLNAFCQELYFAIKSPENSLPIMGSNTIEKTILDLAAKFPHKKINFLGNGVELALELIQQTFGPNASIPAPLPQIASLEAIARLALESWHNNNITYSLAPVYLKDTKAGINC